MHRSLGNPEKVDVVFCLVIGNGGRHADDVQTFWSNLREEHREWHTLARGGEEFKSYPSCGFARAELAEKALVSDRDDLDPPVLLLGFSTGANSGMTVARELSGEGVDRRRLAFVALGHTCSRGKWE